MAIQPDEQKMAMVARSGQAGLVMTLIAATFLMGSSFVAGKILLQDGFSPMILVGWRFLVAALATLPLVFLDGAPLISALMPPRVGLREGALVILIGLIQTAAVMGLLFLAMRSISASTAAILLFTNPIWVAVLGRLFLGESLHSGRAVGLVVGVIGVALAIGIGPSMFSGGPAVMGEIIGIASALCWASATIVNKRAALPFGAWALSFWQMLIGSVAILIFAYSEGQHWPDSTTPAQWGWFLWLAIPASTGSFGLWFTALSKGRATKASSYLFLAPLFTVVLSFFILNSTLAWLQGVGGVLIGFALWLVNREIPARSKREALSEALSEGGP